MPRKHLPVSRLSALILGLALGLCSASVWAAPVVFQATATGPERAVLELETDELVTMKMIPFRLTIKDASGQPLTGAKVRCDMTMPSMAMPENRPKVMEHDDGSYGGELVFTCAQGAWRITCLAEKSDGSTQTAIFEIPRVKMK